MFLFSQLEHVVVSIFNLFFFRFTVGYQARHEEGPLQDNEEDILPQLLRNNGSVIKPSNFERTDFKFELLENYFERPLFWN